MNAINAALQNGKVWARRLDVEVDPVKLEELLTKNFPGSVLKGPLTAVMLRYYKPLLSDDTARKHVAAITAHTLAAVIRSEFKSGANLLAIAGGIVNQMSDEYKTAFATHSQLICDTVAKAIAARAKEKSSPSITNIILNKIK